MRTRTVVHLTFTESEEKTLWINQIEVWFNTFTRDVLRGGVWKSKRELVDQILLYIRKYNKERERPFNWTYTGKALEHLIV
jgi:putative transposase